MKKLLLATFFVLCFITCVFAAQTSTINPLLPLQSAPLTSAPVRNNFAAAYSDINNLYTLVGSGPGGGAVSSVFGRTGIVTAQTGDYNFSQISGNLSLTSQVSGTLPVAQGGTAANSASITAFNNITGYTASGATGTTSTNLVFSASPTVTGTLAGASETLSGTLTTVGSVGIGTASPVNQLDVFTGGIHIGSNTPSNTTNALYAIGTSLQWNGAAVGGGGGGVSLSGNNTWTAGQAVTPTTGGTQSAGGTYTPNFALSNSVTLTFGAGNLTIANPTGIIAGQMYMIALTQDSVGNRTVTWGSEFKWGSGTAPTLSTGVSNKDIISCWADTATTLECVEAIVNAH